MKKQEDVKKVIKAELNTDMEFDGETLEKILELGIVKRTAKLVSRKCNLRVAF